MKVNLNLNFKNFEGVDTQENIAHNLAQVLFSYGSGEQAVTPDDKIKAANLSEKMTNSITSKTDVDLSIDELSFLKKVAGECYTAGAYSQILKIIENGNSK